MIMSGKIIPKIGEPPTTWSFDSTLELSRHLWMCHLACRLMIKVQLNLNCLLSWTHLILISLCYALGLCHSFKSCALPPSILFYALFMSTSPTMLALQSSGETTRKQLALGRERLYNIQSLQRYRPSSSMFLQHVQQQHLSVNPLGQVTGTQCLIEVHLLASLQRQLGFQG